MARPDQGAALGHPRKRRRGDARGARILLRDVALLLAGDLRDGVLGASRHLDPCLKVHVLCKFKRNAQWTERRPSRPEAAQTYTDLADPTVVQNQKAPLTLGFRESNWPEHFPNQESKPAGNAWAAVWPKMRAGHRPSP